jgi:hypothetical protein
MTISASVRVVFDRKTQIYEKIYSEACIVKSHDTAVMRGFQE